MFSSRSTLLAAGAGLAALLAASGAQATYIGTAFRATQAQASNAVIPIPSGLTAIATFTTTNDTLSFSSPTLANYTPGGFLMSGNVTCVNAVAGGCAQDLNNTLWDITGTATVTMGQTFNFMHDDGITLRIDGQNVISAPGPTTPILSTGMYNGPSGTQPVELVYGEVFGPPAQLMGTLPTEVAVPEPASLALLGAGLFGLGVLRRRRRTS